MKKAYRILVRKPEGKTPLERPRRRWEDNIKMELRYDAVIWSGLIWLRIWKQLRTLVNMVMNLRVL
jgi:hypothetical protein